MSMHEKAMLVSLNVRSWTGRKVDRKLLEKAYVGEDVSEDFRNRSSFSKPVVAANALEELNAIASKARAIFAKETLAWATSIGIARVTRIEQLKSDLRDLRIEYDTAADKFCSNIEEYKKVAKASLNGAFEETDYPANLRDKFKFTVRIFPIPDVDDFRVDCSAEDAAELRSEIEDSIKESTRQAIGEIYGKLAKVVKHLVERLEKYDENGKQNPFRDSTVENIESMLQVAHELNFFEDRQLAEMLQRIKDELCDITASELRELPDERKFIAEQANAILADMSAFI